MSIESFAFLDNSIYQDLADSGHDVWALELRRSCEKVLLQNQHGKLREWEQLIRKAESAPSASWSIRNGHVVASGAHVDAAFLREFCPWRKGPFELSGNTIDTEWRSDWKWDRIADHVEWRGRRVLDVGCGNGYFGWRMLDCGARSVLGLDPFLLYVMQHEIVRRLAGHAKNYVLPLSDDCLIPGIRAFDIVLSMGVLYHRTGPIEHLQSLREALRPGGQLVLETLIVEDAAANVLVPEGRYAKMRNVWFIPSLPMLKLWLQRTGFGSIKTIDITRTNTDEQRRTDWMTFESLADFLSPNDHTRTIEGYPGPVRAVVTATASGESLRAS